MSDQPSDAANARQETARNVAVATVVMMAGILLSRLLGVIRNAVISHQFGQGFEADVFYGSFQIPDLIFFVVAGGAVSSAFIPVFTGHIAHNRPERAWKVFSAVATTLFLAISALVVLGELFTGPLVRLVNPGFSEAKVEQTIPLTRIVLPAQLCFLLGSLLMGVQQALGKYRVPSAGPVIYNLGIILGGLLLVPVLGVSGLSWGALAGALAGNFVLQWAGARRMGMRFLPSLAVRDPDVVQVWRMMLPVVLGVALPQVSIWVNRAFATQLGDGPVAAISNANQIMQAPLGIFAQAMAVAIFPTLSSLAAKERWDELRSASSGGIRALLFLTVPASAFLIVLAEPVVQVLLQSGRFGPEDSRLAAQVLQVYAAGIFAWSMQSILSRTFYAMQNSATPVVIGTAITVVFIPMNLLFLSVPGWGARGLALATTVAASLHAVAMVAVLSKKLDGFELRALADSVGRTGLASVLAAAACWAVASVMGAPPPGTAAVKMHALGKILAAGGAASAVYLAAARLLGSRELSEIRSLLRRRRRGPSSARADAESVFMDEGASDSPATPSLHSEKEGRL